MSEADAAQLVQSSAPIAPVGPKATRQPRTTVLRRAGILHRGERHMVRLRNHSATGAMFEANWSPAIGERVHVVIDSRRPLSGVVRWMQVGRFGVLFDENYIGPEVPERVLTKFEHAASVT